MNAKAQAFRSELLGKSHEEAIEAAVRLFMEKEAVNARLIEFQKASTEMSIQFQQMKDELNSARNEIRALQKQNQHLTGIRMMREKDLFGRSTEKTEDILDQAASGKIENPDPLAEDADEAPGEDTDGLCEKIRLPWKGRTGRRRKKQQGKREDDISSLPVSTFFDYDIGELDRLYGEGNWRFTFWERHRKVEVVRQTTYLKVTYTPVISVGLEHSLERIPCRESLLPKSLVSESLLSLIMTDKYGMFLPLYRQEHDPDRFGFPLSRQTMSRCIVHACLGLLLPVYQYMADQLRRARYQQCDETTYLVIHDGRSAGTKSFIWAHRTSELLEGPEIIVYCYEKTRGAGHLREFYAGLSFQICLTCDAYGAYSSFADDMDGLVVLCGCFMHCRRRFVEALALLDLKGLTQDQILELPETSAIALIGEIYNADEPLKGLSCSERLEKRQTEVKEKVDDFFEFVHSFDLDDPSASEKLKEAIRYSRNQETCLRRFLEDGNIPIDDGSTERCIRPVAQGRRNYLFSNTISGARSTAIASTIIETARANGAEPYYYLKYLLEQMPKNIYSKEQTYLPDMMPWAAAYRSYELREKQAAVDHLAPPGNEKPHTPRRSDHKNRTA